MFNKIWNHNKIAYGGDYNPEQWPQETWEDDIIKLKPDLVVIDLMLSEIDGIGVIEKCRELIEPDKIPAFIALTMLENRELMECIRRLKVDYCMMKPFQAGILAERISQMIRIRSVNNDIQKNEKA